MHLRCSSVRSLDVENTPTVNAGRYRRSNAQVYINPDGLHVVTPRKVAGLIRTVFAVYKARSNEWN